MRRRDLKLVSEVVLEPACQPTDEHRDLFFSAFSAEKVAEAKAICASCPLQEPCLERALSLPFTFDREGGVWAGTTPSERKAIAAGRRAREAAA